MKKLITTLLALALVLSLTACGGNDEQNITGTNNETSATTDTTGETQESTASTEGTTEATTPETTTPPTTERDETKPTENTPSETQPAHKHSYSSKVTKAATCTEKGIKTFTCSCGKSYTEDIKAKGHAHTVTDSKKVTCTEDGYTKYTCTCGDTYTETATAKGHSWGEWTVYKDATSNAKGESRRNCKNCTEFESKVIPLKPAKEATADNTINITGTDYEAIVRQYTNDHHHDSYDDEYEGYDFSINGASSNMNVLGLTSFDAAIRVIPFTAEKGELYTSAFQGLSPYASLDGMEVLQKTIADGCVAFKCQPKSFAVDGANDWVQYNSFDEIPESVMQDIINGQARLTVIYNTPGDTEFQLSISHSGNNWFVQLFARYRLPRGI